MSTSTPGAAGGSMSVVHGIDALDPSFGRLFVVVGVFDGLHLCHESLLRELRLESRRRDARPAVITFDHHPDEVITGSAPPLLCDPNERLTRLEAAGVAVTIVQTFDVALRETPFDAFVGRIADRVELTGFLMTPDSAFGYQRAGTPETVAALGREVGFEVAVATPFMLDGEPVSSSAIRAAIASGDFATAERLLGRPYSVVGTPIVGAPMAAARGAAMAAFAGGGSTAIAFPMPVALPPDGRYRAHVAVDGIAPAAGEGSVPPAGWAQLDDGVLRVPAFVTARSAKLVAITFEPGPAEG